MEGPICISFNWFPVKLLQLFIGLIYICWKSFLAPQYLASVCLLSSLKRYAPKRANPNVPVSCSSSDCPFSSSVDVFTFLWKKAKDNCIFLYLYGMANSLGNSVQRRHDVWPGLEKSPFLFFSLLTPFKLLVACSFLVSYCRCCHREITDVLPSRHHLKYSHCFWKCECYNLFKKNHLITIVET